MCLVEGHRALLGEREWGIRPFSPLIRPLFGANECSCYKKLNKERGERRERKPYMRTHFLSIDTIQRVIIGENMIKIKKIEKKEAENPEIEKKEENKEADKKECIKIILLSLVGVVIIGYFDGFAPVPYGMKAGGKCVLFIGIPLLYQSVFGRKDSDFSIGAMFSRDKRALCVAGGMGLFVFTVIFGSYLLLGAVVDLSAVTGQLDERMNINAGNFVAVAVYIATCNSFLEEFYFRGFLFFRLKEYGSRAMAQIGSSVIFALYHVAIMVTWFEWWVFCLCMVALVIGGVIFNCLDEKTESLYPSWLTHGCANVAINTVGMILFFG